MAGLILSLTQMFDCKQLITENKKPQPKIDRQNDIDNFQLG